MEIWAHRGASGYAPENTIQSFKKAIDMGADAIELDVHLTKDGNVVVIHDDTIDRTSDGAGVVSEMTLDELRGHNFNCGHNEYSWCDIPLLSDVLELIRATNLKINIELKASSAKATRRNENDDALVDKILRMVDDYQMKNKIIYSSFSADIIRYIKKKQEDARCGLLYKNGTAKAVKFAKKYNLYALHPKKTLLKCSLITRWIKKKGIRLHVWTVNGNHDMKKLGKMGVDAVITNYPDRYENKK